MPAVEPGEEYANPNESYEYSLRSAMSGTTRLLLLSPNTACARLFARVELLTTTRKPHSGKPLTRPACVELVSITDGDDAHDARHAASSVTHGVVKVNDPASTIDIVDVTSML